MKNSKLRHPSELPFYLLAVCLNLGLFIGVLLLGFAADDLLNVLFGGEVVWFFLVAIPLVVTTRLIKRVSARANGIRLSPDQFPPIFALVEVLTRRFGLRRAPTLYLYTGDTPYKIESGSWFGRYYIELNAELCKMSEEDMEGLTFLIGREFGRIRLHHNSLWNMLSVVYVNQIPVLGDTLQRVRTYSCDRYGAVASPDGISGLVFLAAGRLTYRQVNMQSYLKQLQERPGAWERLLELFATQPYYANRVRALYQLGLLTRKSDQQPLPR